MTDSFNHLAMLLLPPALMAFEWSLQEAELLIFSMALAPRTNTNTNTVQQICDNCGYPFEGLDVQVCPGCGKQLG